MKRSWLFLILALSLVLLAVVAALALRSAGRTAPGSAAADGIVSDDEVNAVAKQLYCPVCENIPLDVCPTQACQQWRDEIRRLLGEGWSEDQVKQRFVDQYGARVLGAPPAEGLSMLVYIVPPLAFLAGAYILYRAFRAWQKPSPPPEPADRETPEAPASDPYIARLEEELRNR
jgi:cytochrome c-type biogenesis protein CcmH